MTTFLLARIEAPCPSCDGLIIEPGCVCEGTGVLRREVSLSEALRDDPEARRLIKQIVRDMPEGPLARGYWVNE
jgi:hypothetical protein